MAPTHAQSYTNTRKQGDAPGRKHVRAVDRRPGDTRRALGERHAHAQVRGHGCAGVWVSGPVVGLGFDVYSYSVCVNFGRNSRGIGFYLCSIRTTMRVIAAGEIGPDGAPMDGTQIAAGAWSQMPLSLFPTLIINNKSMV